MMLLQLLVMSALAAGMAYSTSLLLKWFVRAKDRRAPIDVPFILFILIMMLSMVVSAVAYLLSPSTGLLLDLIVVNMFVMTAGVLPIFLFMSLRLSPEDLEGGIATDGSIRLEKPIRTLRERYGRGLIPLAITIVLLDEFFMGWALVIASGIASSTISLTNPLSLFSSVVNSYWFIFTMSAEMALTTYFLRNEIGRVLAYVVAAQSVIMFLSPTALSSSGWVTASVYGGSAAMIVLFIYFFEFMARNSVLDLNVSQYLFRLLSVYSLMMAGLFVWELYQSGTIFSIAIILEMLLYFYLVLGDRNQSGAKKSWLLDAKWTCGLISLIFVSEFFMGGLFDVQINGGANFLEGLGLVPIAGSILTATGAALYDFLAWFGTVTGSVWFLIMMGIEMGALVAFKIPTARERETKIRLVFVLVAYALYTVALPSFILQDPAKVPFIGWSMGVGTAGAVAPVFLVAIGGTYLISGVLSVLFGSRQTCSVFCMPATMYQGSFNDKKQTFNRSSKSARQFLTTRLSKLYKLFFSLVWGSLFVTILISYLDSVGILNLTIFGSDPTVFAYSLYRNFLWYIIFITIPIVGVYGCVSMGWCHWGTFNQLVSRIGFFKLKVKSTDTCAHCPTMDCARACPVGLTNLPGEFIKKGEMKSHKCIGVGDCVSSCPYEIIQFHDIRHWVRGRISGARENHSNNYLVKLASNMNVYYKYSSEKNRER